MRLQGKITRWEDEKGFGFISRPGEKKPTFIHIKAFPRGSRRPVLGDRVSYVTAQDENGRPRAANARFADQRRALGQMGQGRRAGALPVFAAWLFVGFLFAATYFGRLSWRVVAAYVAVSLVTFLVYAWDKSSARLGKWRTAESSLHFLALIGGWPGALAAQRLLRHKSSKKAFLSVFWVTVFLNVAVAGYMVWRGDSGVVAQLMEAIGLNTR